MKKMTGKEWKEFYNDPQFWGPDVWAVSKEITINNESIPDDLGDVDWLNNMKDTDIVRISGGIVYLTDDAKDGPSLEKYFLDWRKSQNVAKILIEVRKKETDYFKQAIQHMGGKIIG